MALSCDDNLLVLQMNPSTIRQWLRGGDLEKLEQVVLEGHGHRLVGEYSPDAKARTFLKTVPAYMVATLHFLLFMDLLNIPIQCLFSRTE